MKKLIFITFILSLGIASDYKITKIDFGDDYNTSKFQNTDSKKIIIIKNNTNLSKPNKKQVDEKLIKITDLKIKSNFINSKYFEFKDDETQTDMILNYEISTLNITDKNTKFIINANLVYDLINTHTKKLIKTNTISQNYISNFNTAANVYDDTATRLANALFKDISDNYDNNGTNNDILQIDEKTVKTTSEQKEEIVKQNENGGVILPF